MTTQLRQPVWIVPLAIAGLVALFGWWGGHRLRQTIEAQIKAELTATLNANVTALEIWMINQTRLAAVLAEEPRVQTLAATILQQPERSEEPGREPANRADLFAFSNYLRPRLSQINYETAQLVSTNFVVVANARRGLLGLRPVSEAHTNKYGELFASGKPIIITPYKPEPPPPRPGGRGGRNGPPPSRQFLDDRGASGPRGANDFPRGGRAPTFDPTRPRRGDLTLMQVAAPVRDERGTLIGALALIISPDKEFTRILSVARSGESGETYAFDQQGLLISQSRFDTQLKNLGLLDRTNSTSATNFRLHDPGGDLTKGFKPQETDSTRWPLIRIVANAVTNESGLEVKPSRDYRGVSIVGAWRWLPNQGFGVATQIDASEAYRPLRVLQWLFMMLFLLLLLCATGMFLFSYRDLVWRRRLNEAELKLKQLGQYTLEEKIGEGGMGVVYRARHALMRRDTAVKLLLPDRAEPASIQRFEREVCLTCQLTHPNTIQIYDYGRTPEGIFYYAMELLRGLNLHDLIVRFGAQSEGRAIHILVQVCDALAEAHALGLVHRDIKPANVFLCDRGGIPDCVKVLDFGLVREYGVGAHDQMNTTDLKELEGTPSFMPPEAIKDSARIDPRCDIYSVGALGYYLLTGEYVFNAESIIELYERHLTESPAPPSQRTTHPISPEMEKAILRCLEREPNLRPQSVGELRALLLASPRASDWRPEGRSAWWAEYHLYEPKNPTGTDQAKSTLIAPTVKIDFASRIK